jgi:polar amino acid transport system substrate-binding protein
VSRTRPTSATPTARRVPAARACALCAAVMLSVGALASCSGSSTHRSGSRAAASTTTTTQKPPDCGNPVASYAPIGLMPSPGNMPAGTYMAQIQARGRLVAGVAADNLLFGSRNPFTGNLEGFDIDQVHQVAQAIFGDPNRVEYRTMTFSQRIPALTSGSVDVVADVMTINCTRWSQIAFSSEYFAAAKRVLVPKTSTATSIADLEGKRVCAAKGSTSLEIVKSRPKLVAVPVEDSSDCIVLFQQGTVDGVVADDTVLAGFVAQDPYAKIVGGPLTNEPYGLGIAKTHPEFVRFVNQVLEKERTDGTWKALYARWLPTIGAVPEPPTAVYGRQP